MSNSNLKSHRKAAALTVLCVICAHGGDNNARPGDYILRAKQFIRTFYPSLNGGLRVVIDDDQPLRAPGGVRIPDLLNSFHVNLFENGHAMSPLAGSCPTPVFNGYFVFDWRADEKDLVIMTADGQGADSRMVTFLREMEKDPNSSGTEITAALAAAGAQFGPDHKVEFLRSLPIEELRPYVGKIEVVSTEFRRRAAQATGGQPNTLLGWSVEAQWSGPSGLEAHYNLWFEPFEGRIISIFRASSPHKPAGQLRKQ